MRVEDYELLFDLPEGECVGRGIDGVRTATWRAGRSLEVAVYPITRLPAEVRREVKRRRSTPAMARINARNTERHIMRLLEANFRAGTAVVVTGTYAYPAQGDYAMMDVAAMARAYEARRLPWELERVRQDVRNWLARLRRRVKKLGGDPKGFKWLVRIEEGKEPPLSGIPAKFHFHAVIEGPGLDGETVKALWEERHGRCHADPLSLSDDGAARLARYFTKQKSGGRWWSHSRNLKIVAPRVSDRKVSRRRLALLAGDVMGRGRELLEKLYPGYRLAETPVVRYSDFVSGAYVYVRMRRRD